MDGKPGLSDYSFSYLTKNRIAKCHLVVLGFTRKKDIAYEKYTFTTIARLSSILYIFSLIKFNQND